jgi:hypothetical protein
MSTFLERINTDDTSNLILKTGFASFGRRKLPKNETFYINTIPMDRHRFFHFSSYLYSNTLKVNSLFVDSCKTDCRRKLNYTHGKNVNLSDDLYSLCAKRCTFIESNHQGDLRVKYFY